jgi:hypothetical protein
VGIIKTKVGFQGDVHMNKYTLIRWGGLSALVASVISILIEIVLMITIRNQAYSTAALTNEWSLLYTFRLIAVMLLMLGLVALFARQNQKMRAFGVIAFVIASIGTMLIFGFAWALLFVFPGMAEAVPAFLDTMATEPGIGIAITLFLVTVGWFLFGLASLRAKILPAGSAWVVMAGAFLALVLNMMQIPFSWVIFDIGVIWMGWWLWSERVQSAELPIS